MGTQFLQSLTGTQGKATLKHIKALGGSIFKRAVIERRIKVSPWHDVAMPDDAIESARTPHYTWEEAENIISALVDRVDCQLIMALACFLGLAAERNCAVTLGRFRRGMAAHPARICPRKIGRAENPRVPAVGSLD